MCVYVKVEVVQETHVRLTVYKFWTAASHIHDYLFFSAFSLLHLQLHATTKELLDREENIVLEINGYRY